MKLLGSNKNKIGKDENGKSVPHSEITEVVLVQCNIIIYHYQQNLRVLHTFIANKLFSQLLDISPKNYVFKKL